MRKLLHSILSDSSPRLRRKIIGIYIILVGFNGLIWTLTFLISTQFAFVLGTGLLAYTFGLRHGVDADHIAAIDNVTRKLMQEGKRPVAVGLFFSLGHSTIVVALSGVVALASALMSGSPLELKEYGNLIGVSISALFLYLIGIINLVVLIDVYRMFRRVTRGEAYSEVSLEEFLDKRGFMNRFFGRLMRTIDKSWKMYPLGVLFGLGFETAAEVALLGISATAAGDGLPVIVVMLFPLLFAAGMTLVDTTDSILMLGAYGWAFVKPIRKLYYNLNITLLSVLVALVIGTIEALSVLAGRFELDGAFWTWIRGVDFETLGYIIIGLFGLSWLVSTLVYKIRGYDRLEITTEMSETKI